MLTDFDLIWSHVKNLAEKLMATDASMLDDTLYTQYNAAFEQLMQVIEADGASINQEQLADMQYVLGKLESAFAEYQERLKGSIAQNRIKSKLEGLYTPRDAHGGLNKKL